MFAVWQVRLLKIYTHTSQALINIGGTNGWIRTKHDSLSSPNTTMIVNRLCVCTHVEQGNCTHQYMLEPIPFVCHLNHCFHTTQLTDTVTWDMALGHKVMRIVEYAQFALNNFRSQRDNMTPWYNALPTFFFIRILLYAFHTSSTEPDHWSGFLSQVPMHVALDRKHSSAKSWGKSRESLHTHLHIYT